MHIYTYIYIYIYIYNTLFAIHENVWQAEYNNIGSRCIRSIISIIPLGYPDTYIGEVISLTSLPKIGRVWTTLLSEIRSHIKYPSDLNQAKLVVESLNIVDR